MSIQGKTETREDLIALTGLYIEEGNRCEEKPWSAKKGKVLIDAFVKCTESQSHCGEKFWERMEIEKRSLPIFALSTFQRKKENLRRSSSAKI